MAESPVRRPSLRQLARELGLSATTVSWALRGRAGVSSASAARIRTHARQRGYYPDPELSRLSHLMREGRDPGFRPTLAFLNGYPQRDRAAREPYFAGLWQGAKAEAERLGFRLEHYWLAEPGLTPRRLAGILAARGIRGVLLPPVPEGVRLDGAGWESFAAVALTDAPAMAGRPRVAPDNAGAVRTALAELTRLGYRRPGLVLTPDLDHRTQGEHSGAFLRAIHPRGGGAELLRVEEPDVHRLASWWAAAGPDVVIFPHPSPFAARWREVAVTVERPPAFVSLAWSARFPEFAGIDKRTDAIGRHGVGLLVAALTQGVSGPQADPPTMRVPVRWEPGASCPPAARRTRPLAALLRTMRAP